MLNQNCRLQSVHRIAGNPKLPYRYQDFHPKSGTHLLFGWTKVWLPERKDKELTLIVFLDPEKSPVALLTNEKPKSPEKVARLISYYLGRYSGCEDPVRFLKQEFKLEKFLIENLRSLRNWFFWISVAFTMLFDFQIHREILRKIIAYSKPFPKFVTFLYYRILRGMSYLLRDLLTYNALPRAKIG